MQSIGMVETKGLIASIESADIMLKTADVKLLSKTVIGAGLVTITVEGDVAAVKSSVDAAISAVERLGREFLISSHVIARPVEDIGELVEKKETDFKKTKKDEIKSHDKDDIKEEDSNIYNIIPEDEKNDIQELEYADDNLNDIEEKNKKFNIKSIDKKNLGKEELEKIIKNYDANVSQKILESLNLTELRKLAKEYDGDIVNISKLSKAKLIAKISDMIN